jgi:predicted RNA binding protein YcfA (HicA-like mRNA interferase family)
LGRLPAISGGEAICAFERLGWNVHRRESSHVSMHKVGNPLLLTIPEHKELGRGILRGLIRTAGISVDEFVDALAK